MDSLSATIFPKWAPGLGAGTPARNRAGVCAGGARPRPWQARPALSGVYPGARPLGRPLAAILSDIARQAGTVEARIAVEVLACCILGHRAGLPDCRNDTTASLSARIAAFVLGT